jgi:hypothetical protein
MQNPNPLSHYFEWALRFLGWVFRALGIMPLLFVLVLAFFLLFIPFMRYWHSSTPENIEYEHLSAEVFDSNLMFEQTKDSMYFKLLLDDGTNIQYKASFSNDERKRIKQYQIERLPIKDLRQLAGDYKGLDSNGSGKAKEVVLTIYRIDSRENWATVEYWLGNGKARKTLQGIYQADLGLLLLLESEERLLVYRNDNDIFLESSDPNSKVKSVYQRING